MKEIVKYIGLFVIIIGVVLLSITVLNQSHTNSVLVVSLILIVSGMLGHIVLNRLLS